jgi:hypothetical protein
MLATRVRNHRAACFLAAGMALVLVSAAFAQAPTAEQMADYRARLWAYSAAREAYQQRAGPYWVAVKAKRAERLAKRRAHRNIVREDYVLTQPPEYTGPKKPVDPSATAPEVPVAADFLRHAAEEFDFTPERPTSEIAFKRAYAHVAAQAGLTRDQAVRIYGFEATGSGTYTVQAGLEYDKPGAMPITTALGYNQLLATNTVEIVAEKGNQFVKRLTARAAELPDGERQAFDDKIAVLRKMVSFSTSVPDAWGEHERLANTSKGLGIHAINLDIDLGPLLQTQKLLDSVIFARRKGYEGTLTAADLEMMNLTGDGNGFDMVTLPAEWRGKVPTANFFQRSGYLDNPVAQRNNVVGKLIAATDARMDEESKKAGARELAAALQ